MTNKEKIEYKKRNKGYFVRSDVINIFLNNLPNFNKKRLKILDAGGGNGYLLNKVKNYYKKNGISSECWIVDLDKKELNKAPKGITKINNNLLKFVKKEYFDLIIMRSVDQFICGKKQKIVLINNIHDSLKKRGFFMNQTLFFEYPDNKVISRAYRYFKRNLDIENLNGILNIYDKSKFKGCKITSFFPEMLLKESDLMERFGLKNKIINKIYSLLKKNIEKLNSIRIIEKNKFIITANYFLLISQKNN